MNIILIQSDQQRRDSLPCYGNDIIQTPNLDKLAAEGVVFDNAFTPTPICAPARASLLTGRLLSRHGILRNPESGSPAGWDFKADFPTYADAFKAQGYAAHHIGKWHIGSELTAEECGMEGVHYPGYGFPSNHSHYTEYLQGVGQDGFNLEHQVYARYPDGSQGPLLSAVQQGGVQASVPYYLTEQLMDAVRGSADKGKPFFVSVNFWGPHVPYIIPQEYMDMYQPADMVKPFGFEDDLTGKPPVQQRMKEYWGVQDLAWDDWAQLTAACYGYISLIDAQVGRILGLLDELGLADNTAVIYTTDHGGMVGNHGLCDKGPYLYDDVCRIPLIIRMPGAQSGTNSSYVYNMDLMPTMIELAGGTVPEGLDSASLLPLVTGETEQVRDPQLYMEFYGHQVPVSQKLLRTDTWKYIFNGQDEDEFYDLEQDPHELCNRIADPAYAGAIRAAREQLLDKLKIMKDPVLRYFTATRIHGPS